MSDPYTVYNNLVDLMCRRCNPKIRRECKSQNEDERCKRMCFCMDTILEPNDEKYPVKLPKVK